MSPERKLNQAKTERQLHDKAARALDRYIELLKHYNIPPDIQEAALRELIEKSPEQIIAEVNQYWEEEYPKEKPSSNCNKTKINQTTLSPVETIIYERRRSEKKKRREIRKRGKKKEINRHRNY